MGASGEPGDIASARVIVDQSADLWAALGPGARAVVVTDNAGRELLADLVLVDQLLQRRQLGSVSLHVKPYPYYVSDATTADVVACLRRLTATRGTAAEIAHRLHKAMAEETVSLYTHEFYCAPWSFHRMAADLVGEFGHASLTILKGDLNYRRLVGDRHWPPTTPFTDVAAYFPGPLVALRTLKSDVITGLDPATVADLDATGQPWRTDGAHGLLQARQR
jgi:Damage-control phosphatase ARMT1-like domain